MLDAYISKCSEATKPVVKYLIGLVRETIPGIEERIKWGSPSFELNGKIVCQVMAHKKHVSFIFVQGKLMKDNHGLLTPFGEKSNMNGFKYIEKIEDLPAKEILQDYIKTAAAHLKKAAL
jgi:hypothetical protein